MQPDQLPLETRSLQLRQFVPGDAGTALILSNEETARAWLPSQVYRDHGPLDDEVEIGFSIAQQYQKQGLANEAIVAASRWAIEAFALERILAITSATNLASRRTLLRARFLYEGDRTMRFQGAEEAVSVYALSSNSGRKCGGLTTA